MPRARGGGRQRTTHHDHDTTARTWTREDQPASQRLARGHTPPPPLHPHGNERETRDTGTNRKADRKEEARECCVIRFPRVLTFSPRKTAPFLYTPGSSVVCGYTAFFTLE